jgi:hypothetical protein
MRGTKPSGPCCKCGRPKEGENLTKNGRCRHCKNEYGKTHYSANRQTYIWKGNEAKQRLFARNLRRLIGYLFAHPCVDCGETDPLVLEFDHRDPDDKQMNVNELASRVAWEQVEVEVAKCDVRCANCHRRRSSKQLGHLRYRMLVEMTG